MKIQDRIMKHCESCGHATGIVQEEAFGCDACKKPIDLYAGKRHRQYLEVTVFNEGQDTDLFQFCSWACCLNGLKKVKSNYFVSLPYLLYDEKQKGIRAKDFFAAIKAFK